MVNVLFLDDMEWRHLEFAKVVDHMSDVWLSKAYTAGAAIELLGLSHFDQVFLDHDLSEEDVMIAVDAPSAVPTGMTVVDHILTMSRPPTQVVVHSCNTPAACKMVSRLEGHPAGIWVRRLAFPEMLNRMNQVISRHSQR